LDRPSRSNSPFSMESASRRLARSRAFCSSSMLAAVVDLAHQSARSTNETHRFATRCRSANFLIHSRRHFSRRQSSDRPFSSSEIPASRRRPQGRRGNAVRCPRLSAGRPIPAVSATCRSAAAAPPSRPSRHCPTRRPSQRRFFQRRRRQRPSPDRLPDAHSARWWPAGCG